MSPTHSLVTLYPYACKDRQKKLVASYAAEKEQSASVEA